MVAVAGSPENDACREFSPPSQFAWRSPLVARHSPRSGAVLRSKSSLHACRNDQNLIFSNDPRPRPLAVELGLLKFGRMPWFGVQFVTGVARASCARCSTTRGRRGA